ncbi:MAG: PD-(D/E)XK nuclease family protein [Candidatus Avilachnospira sp.]|jgi:ATP-dependent helicase/nuclease subunit B
MAYRFIFGDFASGKTEYVYREIIEQSMRAPEKMFYMVVPEQNTLKAQQEIIRRHPRHGMLNIDVLSFNLLAYRVMDELGIKKPDILDEVSKSMILREACETVSDRLVMYGRKLSKPGFINQMKSIISEFYQYGVGEEDLERALNDTEDSILKAKLNDIGLIFGEFKKKLTGDYAAAEEINYILTDNLYRSKIPDKAVFIFDGFAEFTPVQLKIIEGIMSKAERTEFSLTIADEEDPYRRDTGPLRAADLYYLTREMTAKLTDMASKLGISREEDVRVSHKKDIGLKLVSCKDTEEEARFAASYTEKLVREEGLRYRDIAIAASDMESFREGIKRAFDSAGIPYFMDTKETADENACAEFIRSAVDVAAESFSQESVLRFLKNPFSSGIAADRKERAAERKKKDICDNYIRALGIRGRQGFKREWTAVYKGFENGNLKELNEFKDGLCKGLFSLSEGLKAESVSEKCSAVLDFLNEDRTGEKVAALCSELEREGSSLDAKKYMQIFEASVSLIARLGALMGDRQMKLSDFRDILEAGFSELKVGLIPAKLDQVIVGDLRRSRFEGVKVLMIMGAVDGAIPSSVTGGGILSDRERLMLLNEDIDLAPADAEESCIQKFYLNMNMEKPSRELLISFSRSDASGKALKPSEIIKNIRDKYREKYGAEKEIIPAESFMFIKSPEEALLAFAEGMREEALGDESGRKRNLELYRLLKSLPQNEKKAENVLKAAFFGYGGSGISEKAAALLYGDILYGSVTRIESFNECAYKHFLRYGLRLMERQQADIEASDIGNLYHRSIDRAFSMIREEGLSLKAIGEDELKKITDEAVTRVCDEYNNEIMQSSQRNAYIKDRVRRISRRTLWALQRQLKKGDFEVYGCELPFSYRSDRLSLHGRIDRVDRYEDESRVYVKIIDYKSGRTKFDLSLVYEGLQLQLVSYMDVAVKRAEAGPYSKEVVPAGIFYYNIDDPVTEYGELSGRELLKEESERLIFEKLRMNGLVNADSDALIHMDRDLISGDCESKIIPVSLKGGQPSKRGSSAITDSDFKKVLEFSEKKLKECSDEIMAGKTDIRPYAKGSLTGCDYCPYHSICGFDTRIEGFYYRGLTKLTGDELLKRITEECREDEVDS